MRIALFVYDCIPFAGSEFGLGWQWVQLARRNHEVIAFTLDHYRAAIESAGPLENVRFEYVPLRDRLGPVRRRGTVTYATHCILWYRRAVKRALELQRSMQFDLAHQATMSAYWLPTPLWKLGIPLLIGPVTGGEEIHPAFLERSPLDVRISESLRLRSLKLLTQSADWRKTYMGERTLVVATTRKIEQRLKGHGIAHVEAFRPSFTIYDSLLNQLESIRRRTPKAPVPTFTVSGRQVSWKGHDLALRAFAVVLRKTPDAILHLIGGGPDHPKLLALVRGLGLDASVRVHREIDREEERQLIAQSHLFLFPSRRDGGATVPLLAMALGTPTVGFDVGPIEKVVGDSAKLIRVSKSDVPELVLAKAMLDLSGNHKLRAELSRRGQRRVRTSFSEAVLEKRVEDWYRATLSLARSHAEAIGRSAAQPVPAAR